MKPQEALNLLNNAVQQLSANLATHVKLQEAVQTLQPIITRFDDPNNVVPTE